MAGKLTSTADGNGHWIWPVVWEGRSNRGGVSKGCGEVGDDYCAELRVNGHHVPSPLNGCWCRMHQAQPSDEVILNLGKSVLEGLTKYPLKGQDGSLLVVVEVRF